jgi:hypothetical protein
VLQAPPRSWQQKQQQPTNASSGSPEPLDLLHHLTASCPKGCRQLPTWSWTDASSQTMGTTQLALVELPPLQLPHSTPQEEVQQAGSDLDLQHSEDTEAVEKACRAEAPGASWWGRACLLSWLLVVHVGWRSLRTAAAC